jgi:predicted GIY-YIG superfamily endonuclease
MTKEFENFDRTMRDLMSVPHDEIKAALDAEKAIKKKKKKRKAKKPSASAHVAGDGD